VIVLNSRDSPQQAVLLLLTVTIKIRLFVAALWNRAGHYIFALWFLSFFFLLLFYSSPNLCGRILDVYCTSTHGVALVRIYNAGLKCAARGLLEMQYPKNRKKIAIWATLHYFVGLYLRN